MRNFPKGAFTPLACLAFLAAACTPTPVATPTPEPTPTSTVDPVAVGVELYQAKACFACHGEDTQGTDQGPGIGGHDIEAVISQVRNPTGDMPAFGPDKISDEELGFIAAYVAAQPSTAMALGIEPTEAERGHLMAVLEALEQGDPAGAIEHLGLAVDLATGDNRKAYEDWLKELEEDQLSMVEHEIEDLLGSQ